jgi:hypothetical protein
MNLKRQSKKMQSKKRDLHSDEILVTAQERLDDKFDAKLILLVDSTGNVVPPTEHTLDLIGNLPVMKRKTKARN